MSPLFGNSDTARAGANTLLGAVSSLLPEGVKGVVGDLSPAALRALAGDPPKGGVVVSGGAPAAASQPAQTRAEAGISDFIANNKTSLILLAVVVGVAFLYYRK